MSTQPTFEPPQTYGGFSRSDRVQHWLMAVSFLVLTCTGLPQKYIYLNNRYLGRSHRPPGRARHGAGGSPLGGDGADAGDRLSPARRGSPSPRAAGLSMLPRYQDLADALKAVRYNLGFDRERPRMDRYTWEEKVEYWSLIWGTVVMIATGFMLWNPVATARFLPGQWIPAAQVIHGGEALLAILAVLVWHFYSVHLRSFNRSMFNGSMTEHEMEHEHPLELEKIKAGKAHPADDAARIRR